MKFNLDDKSASLRLFLDGEQIDVQGVCDFFARFQEVDRAANYDHQEYQVVSEHGWEVVFGCHHENEHSNYNFDSNCQGYVRGFGSEA